MKHPLFTHPFKLRPGTSDDAVFHQLVDAREYDFNTPVPPKGIIDAGANIGLTSALFATRYPNAYILAVEPEASNFALLLENVHPYPNIIPVFGAVWSKNTTIAVDDIGLNKWGFVTHANPTQQTVHRAPAFDLSTLLRLLPAQCDILKMDIEGAEAEVMISTNTDLGAIGSVIIELHDGIVASCSEVCRPSLDYHYGNHWAVGYTEYYTNGGITK